MTITIIDQRCVCITISVVNLQSLTLEDKKSQVKNLH